MANASPIDCRSQTANANASRFIGDAEPRGSHTHTQQKSRSATSNGTTGVTTAHPQQKSRSATSNGRTGVTTTTNVTGVSTKGTLTGVTTKGTVTVQHDKLHGD